MKRFFRGLAALLAAVIILSGAAAAFAEEEKVYTLPIDLSEGKPYQDSIYNKENQYGPALVDTSLNVADGQIVV